MNEQDLMIIAGIVASLFFSYVPGLAPKYDALSATYKRLIMLGVLLLTTAGIYGVACLDIFDIVVSCDQAGAVELIRAFVLAGIANQSTFLISPKPEYAKAK